MRMLKVLDFRFSGSRQRIMSLPSSLKFLVNLRTLHLDGCKLGNLSELGILKKLEILSFVNSNIRALPEEIGELINLRLLDLTWCEELEKIPPNVISKLTRLEELYVGHSFRNWEVEGTSEERSSASLSELQLLRRLTNLCVHVNEVACFPDNFLSPNLQKIEIEVRDWYRSDFRNYYPNSRSLYLRSEEVPSSKDFKTLIQMVEDLTLSLYKRKCDNILAGIDAGGLNGLKSLKLSCCNGIESLINTNQRNRGILFANLEKLHLIGLDNMEVLCRGLIPDGSLEKLRVLKIEHCPKLQAIVDLVHKFKKLEEVEVQYCEEVEVIFQLNDEIVAEQEHGNLVLSTLKKLSLKNLPELLSVWNGSSTSLVSLCNLTVVEIENCMKLRNLFSPSLAQSLLNLQTLKISFCKNLETIVAEDQKRLSENEEWLEIVCPDGREEEEGGDEKEILLPQLHKLELEHLPKLERLCPPGSFVINVPSLKELVVYMCPMLKSTPNLVIVQDVE